MFDLTGKRALITGASGGIGGAIAAALHTQGATVAVSGTRAAALESLSARLGGRVHPLVCDLGDSSAVDALVPQAMEALGLSQVPVTPEVAAHTMTAPRYPQGVTAADLLPRVTAAGAILAGGLHPQIKNEYFRIGHMGPAGLGDILATVGAIETGLAACGYGFERGAGVAAAMAAW